MTNQLFEAALGIKAPRYVQGVDFDSAKLQLTIAVDCGCAEAVLIWTIICIFDTDGIRAAYLLTKTRSATQPNPI
ncbi:hypothetical protein ACFQVB_44395 [Paraburkholderia humisilvae]|nr:hypothetical protein [Paraburkholderia humisilvae]